MMGDDYERRRDGYYDTDQSKTNTAAMGVALGAGALMLGPYRYETWRYGGYIKAGVKGAGRGSKWAGAGIWKGYNWFRKNKLFDRKPGIYGNADYGMMREWAEKTARHEYGTYKHYGFNSFRGGSNNPLNKIEEMFDNPRGLGARAHWWQMSGKQNIAASWKTSLRWGSQGLPIIGGLSGTINMTMAATMAGNPFKNYAAGLIDPFISGGLARVGTGVGMGLGRMVGGGLGRILGGVIGGTTGMIAGNLISYAAVEVPGMIQNFVKENIRFNTFNKQLVDSEGAQTMRQASLMAIRNTELNNRSFILGQEANYFSGGF